MIRTDHTYRIALFGHRDFCPRRAVDEQVCFLLKELIRIKPFVEIYVGRNGEFDIYAATVVGAGLRDRRNGDCRAAVFKTNEKAIINTKIGRRQSVVLKDSFQKYGISRKRCAVFCIFVHKCSACQ